MAATQKLTNIEAQSSKFFDIKDIGTFMHNLMNVILIVASISTLFYLVWGGIEFIFSGSNADRTKTAKEKLTQGFIGLAIVAVTWVLWRLIIYFLGITDSASGPFQVEVPSP